MRKLLHNPWVQGALAFVCWSILGTIFKYATKETVEEFVFGFIADRLRAVFDEMSASEIAKLANDAAWIAGFVVPYAVALVVVLMAFWLGRLTKSHSIVRDDTHLGLPLQDEITDGTANKKTLHDYFLEDFQKDNVSLMQTFTLDLIRGGETLGHFEFEMGIFIIVSARSYFISLWIPGNAHAFELAMHLSSGYKHFLDDTRKTIQIWSDPQGDLSQPIFADMTFTMQTYIYHDNIFSDAQIHDLNTAYRNNGLRPVFRGFGYLRHQELKRTAREGAKPDGAR